MRGNLAASRTEPSGRPTVNAPSILHLVQGHWLVIGFAALVLWIGYKFIRNEDFAEHLSVLKFGLVFLAATFLAGMSIGKFSGSPLAGACACVVLAIPALVFLFKVFDRAFNDSLGGFVFDLLFNEGPFAEKIRTVRKKRPNLTLLRHWRDSGHVRKASRTVRGALANDRQCFGHWLFAIETALLYERSPYKATRLARRLIRLKEISEEQKLYAVKQLETWSDLTGKRISLNPPAPVVRRKPFEEAVALREQGYFEEAETRLRHVLTRDHDNFAALQLLIRLYAQDLKRPDLAEKTFDELKRTPHVPGSLVDFVEKSLSDWIGAPPCAERKKRSFWERLSFRSPKSPAFSPMSPESQLAADQPTADSPELGPDPSMSVADLLKDGYIGTALERAQTEAEAQPTNFAAQRQLLDAYCRGFVSIKNAEKLLAKIEREPKFKEQQKQEAREIVKNAKSAEQEISRKIY